MKTITAIQKERYCKEGYLVLKSEQVRDLKNILRRDLRSMALRIIKNHPEYAPFFNKLHKEGFAQIFDWCIRNERENAIDVITNVFTHFTPDSHLTWQQVLELRVASRTYLRLINKVFVMKEQ